MSTVNINGTAYSGNNVVIKNNKVYIDGVLSSDVTQIKSKKIVINITGKVESLKVDTCETVKVTGDVGELNTVNGDVKVDGSVKGDVQTVNGDVSSKESILGGVKTVNGDIKCKKNTGPIKM